MTQIRVHQASRLVARAARATSRRRRLRGAVVGDQRRDIRLEPAHEATPERLFERRWALSLLDRVLDRLEREVNLNNKGPLFEQLKPTLMGESEGASYAQIGADPGMTVGAVKVAAHRLRKRYRALLKEEVARTLADPVDFDQEINELFQALRL